MLHSFGCTRAGWQSDHRHPARDARLAGHAGVPVPRGNRALPGWRGGLCRIARAAVVLTACAAAAAQAAAHDPVSEDPVPDPAHPPAIMELSVTSDGMRLPGLMYIANGPGPHPTVVLLHGIPGNEKNLDIAQALRRAGFNVLFFHYRGAWGAEGSYSVLQVADDALAALALLQEPENAARYRVDTGRLSLLGHSLGGFASLRAGSLAAEVRCVGAIAPANFAARAAGIGRGDDGAQAFLDYADTLYMLRDFDGERLRRQLQRAAPEEIDTRLFASGW